MEWKEFIKNRVFLISLIASIILGILQFFFKGTILDILFTIAVTIAISTYFDLSTRKAVERNIKQFLELSLSRIFIPDNPNLKKTFQDFLVYINRECIPYEKKREVDIRFRSFHKRNQFVELEVINKITFDSYGYRKTTQITRKFEYTIPIEFLEEELGFNINENERKLIERIREFCFKDIKILDKTVDKGEILKNERIDLTKTLVIYKGEIIFDLPINNQNTPFHLEVHTKTVENSKNFYLLIFKTFCQELSYKVSFDSSIPKSRKFDVILCSYKGLNDLSRCHKRLFDDNLHLYCKELLPGAVILLEWNFEDG